MLYVKNYSAKVKYERSSTWWITILLLCYNTDQGSIQKSLFGLQLQRGNSVCNRAEMVRGRQLEQHLRAHIRNSKQEVGRTNWKWRLAFESWACPWWHTSPARPHILILLKKPHKLGSKYSNSLVDGGHLNSDHHSTSVLRKCAIWV